MIWPQPKRSCSAENSNAHAPSARKSKTKFAVSVPISTRSGHHNPTTDRDRKELLRPLLEEVIVAMNQPEHRAHLILRWRGGALTELDLSLPRNQPRGIRIDEDTLSLLRRLGNHYSDDVIAGILNRQGRKTATGERFTAVHVGGLRAIETFLDSSRPAEPPTGKWRPFAGQPKF